MSNVTSNKSSAPEMFNAKSAAALTQVELAKKTGRDALNGRYGARTHAIHVVLVEAFVNNEALKMSVIAKRATDVLGRDCNAVAPHMQTMKLREFVTSENGAYKLTDRAAELCGAKQAPPAAPKTKRVRKTKK
jgi:hypothetical protein